MNKVSVLTAVFISVLPCAKAAVSLVDATSFFATADTGTSLEITGAEFGDSLNLSGSKLVVTIGGEGQSNGSTDNTVSSVFFGDTEMNLAVAANSGNRRVSIWYLDLAGVTLTDNAFDVNFVTGQEGIALGAYTLLGTIAGDPDTSATTTSNSTLNLTTDAANAFVIAAAARNNWDTNGGPSDTLSRIQSPLNTLHYKHVTQGTEQTTDGLFAGATAGATVASGYGSFPTAGNQSLSIYDMDNSTSAFAAVSFIPEPSSIALFGLGYFGLFLYRRRG